jgi:secreted trypsin-like serine protease
VTRTRSRVLAAAAVALAMLMVGTATPATAATGDPDGPVTPMIVGGQPASQVYRGVGSLQYQNKDNPNFHECEVNLWVPPEVAARAGTRPVLARHAVTNAHCVTEYPTATLEDPRSFHMRFNSNDRLAGGIETGAWKSAVYDTWSWGANPKGTVQGDIAVLWLTKPVYTILSILPPYALKRVPMGPARILGWGYTAYPWDQPDSPRKLSELDTAIVDPSHCAAAAIDAGEVCVADLNHPDRAACFGDSGGPVMVKVPHTRSSWYLIGTASRETAVACAGPVVYTSILYYRDWINQTINGTYKPLGVSLPTDPIKPPGYHWAGR